MGTMNHFNANRCRAAIHRLTPEERKAYDALRVRKGPKRRAMLSADALRAIGRGDLVKFKAMPFAKERLG